MSPLYDSSTSSGVDQSVGGWRLVDVVIGLFQGRIGDFDLGILLGSGQKLEILVAHHQLLDLRLDLFQRRGGCVRLSSRRMTWKPNWVLTGVLRILALFKREGSLGEFRHHAALGEVTEIAAVRSLFGSVDFSLASVGKILAGIKLLDDSLGFVLGLDQDVAGLDLFRRR